jgi:hypothetical protein
LEDFFSKSNLGTVVEDIPMAEEERENLKAEDMNCGDVEKE